MGEIASANCVVPKGDLPLKIRWSLNSAPIVHGENGFTLVRLNKRTSSLNIDSLTALHRGAYKCIASNEAGTSEYIAELQVNGLFVFWFKVNYSSFVLTLNTPNMLNALQYFRCSAQKINVLNVLNLLEICLLVCSFAAHLRKSSLKC